MNQNWKCLEGIQGGRGQAVARQKAHNTQTERGARIRQNRGKGKGSGGGGGGRAGGGGVVVSHPESCSLILVLCGGGTKGDKGREVGVGDYTMNRGIRR